MNEQINYDKLIILYISGDHRAFEELVLIHRSGAEKFAQKYLIDMHHAEDIVQEAFATVYVQRGKFNKDQNFKTYLYTIIRNKCVDLIRKETKLILSNQWDMVTDETPEDNLLVNERKKLLHLKLDELRKPYKTAIHLVDIEDMSYKDAAKIMDKSISSFKVTLMRARKTLKKQLEGMV